MNQIIKIKKGLDIRLKGQAQKDVFQPVMSDQYAIYPDDFQGFTPKISVKIGDKIKAGSPLLYDKFHPEVKITSPVSGEIIAINRGAKRKLLDVIIQTEGPLEYVDFGKKNPQELTPKEIILSLVESGVFAFIRQRPYDIVANPQDIPRDIFIPGFYSAPLAPDLEYLLKGQETDFQTGLDALSKLTNGKLYLGIHSGCKSDCLKNARNVEIITFEGPHPSGNVGVQINQTKPINKGEIIWTVNPADVLFIGRLFNKGIADFFRLIALTGSEIRKPRYCPAILGTSICNLIKDNTTKEKTLRFISGNVLTGTTIPEDGHLHAYDNQITVIPEGDNVNDFFGWASLGFNKFSSGRAFLSKLTDISEKKEYIFDARIKGGKRAMIMSNEYNKVFPMDILPEYLLKSIIAFDIDKMENLGIYEVAPEDFALCEFVDTSKIEIQQLIRTGLDLLYKEMN